MRFRFEKGKAYYACPVMAGAKKIIVACCARYGRTATFTRVNMLRRAEIRPIDDRETVMLAGDDGLEYMVSAAVDVDLENAAKVLEAMGK